MALLQDLIKQIDDMTLRQKITTEVNKLSKQKKFGLVFEEHLPECTALYDVAIRRDSKVALKNREVSDIYIVRSISGDKVICEHKIDHVEAEFAIDDLVAVAEFGDPIYPYLKPIDTVCNAPDSNLWHTLIEADNYHALQLLEYLYAGKVDCIYIDPPYNTGARDWKYNNDYVDGSDAYRHSKWLSFMEKRLKLAKKLLKTKDSVLIVTIDEKEYTHLGCLLEEIFPEAYIQMITIVINPKGSTRGHFSRVEEYAYFCFMPDAYISGWKDSMLGEFVESDAKQRPRWKGLLRSGMDSRREDSPNLFYPILVDRESNTIVRAEESIPLGINPDYEAKIDGYDVAWPIRNDGSQGRWMLSTETFNRMLEKGYISIGRYDKKRSTWGFSYLSKKYQEQIEIGELEIVGNTKNGQSVVVEYKTTQDRQVKTVWYRTRHDAGAYGSDLISNVIGRSRPFSYPKSLYSVEDSIGVIVGNKSDALIVDFFAGSGTTLHAVNLMNAKDGGQRRCIMVTNNEVSEAEAKSLTKQGFKPGDEEWEKLGIARYVTWPRTVCSIEGHDVNGNPLEGNYLGSDLPMSNGFEANAAYFKLGFLDKASIRVGMQFREMLPTLWMKAGCHGACPSIVDQKIPEYIILPENHMAILNDNSCYAQFADELANAPEVETVYLVTDSDTDYRSMSRGLSVKQSYQLYRDYLDNFRINNRR